MVDTAVIEPSSVSPSAQAVVGAASNAVKRSVNNVAANSSVSVKKLNNAKSKAANTDVKENKPKVKSNHPPVSEMVVSAIKILKERNGSSLQAIKKYLIINYKVDTDKLSPFIKKFIKLNVTSGQLIQTKGKGASGSFKLSALAKKEKKVPAKPTVASKKIGAVKEKKKTATSSSTPSKKKSVTNKKVAITKGGGSVKKVKKVIEKKKIISGAKLNAKKSDVKTVSAGKQQKTIKKKATGEAASATKTVIPKQKSTKAKANAADVVIKKPKTPKAKKPSVAVASKKK